MTQSIKASIQRLDHLNSIIDVHERFLARLEELKEKPHTKVQGYIKIFDSTGNNSVSIDAVHLAPRPELLHQSLYNNLVQLIDERDKLTEVFSVTERLLKP